MYTHHHHYHQHHYQTFDLFSSEMLLLKKSRSGDISLLLPSAYI